MFWINNKKIYTPVEVIKKYGEHYSIGKLKTGQSVIMAGGKGTVKSIEPGIVKISVSNGNGKDYTLNQSQFDKDVQINESMSGLEPFETPGGLHIEFYDEPRVLDREDVEDYLGDNMSDDIHKLLAVPFMVKRNDEIFNLVFVTANDTAEIVPASIDDDMGMRTLIDSDEGDLVKDEMKSRFSFHVPKTVLVDDVLDKINAEGIDSLTTAQRDILDRASNESLIPVFVPRFDDFINEKWDGNTEIKQTGQYSGKTIEELEKMKNALKAKKDHTEAETKKLRQINFAIRAKRNWKGVTESVNGSEKYFDVTDKTGRSMKPYKLDKTHIEKTWDLSEEDWDSEKTLADFLENCYIGDTWNTRTVKFECTAIK